MSHAMDARPRVLYISYNSAIEPLGPTQVVPYVRALAREFRMTLLTFEKPVRSPEEDARARAQTAGALRAEGIEWIQLAYHKRPSLPATLYDVAQGIWTAARAHRRARFAMVHARGYVPAAIAWGLKRCLGIPYLFDIRGLQAEEYADAGHWRTSSAAYRITKRVEQWILRDAGGIVTLTEAIRPALARFPGLAARPAPPPSEVIPSCVDLRHFMFRAEGRDRIRRELGVGNRPVLVYAGSLGTWYLFEEMARFAVEAKREIPGLFFLVLANGDGAPARQALARAGLAEGQDAAVRSARFEEMPDYLSAADAGIAFIKACLSKRSSSPTKYAEYLACGLPLIVNAGVGDADRLMADPAAGVLVESMTPAHYAAAAAALRPLLGADRARVRAIAERHFSLEATAAPAYARLYRRIQAPARRLLVLCPYPLHCAPSQRLKFEQYYEAFERAGIRVTVSPFVSAPLWRILYRRGRVLEKIGWTLLGYAKRVRDFLRAGRFDAVYVHLWAVPFGPPWFEEALARRGIAFIYDIDDLVYLPKASEANAFMRRLRAREARIPRIMRAARHVITSTDYLRQVAARVNPQATYISSTINTDRYRPRSHGGQPARVTVGWSGSHSTAPYLRLLTPVLQALARRYPLRLLVIGDAEFSMDGVTVEARPWTLDGEVPGLAEMDVGVYPLPDEEWVLGKSGLKALQYMGMGVPVVASRVGAATEFIQDGENGFLAGSAEEWMTRMTELIERPELRARMGRAGRATVEQRFSVATTSRHYLSIVAHAVGLSSDDGALASRVVPAAADVVFERATHAT